MKPVFCPRPGRAAPIFLACLLGMLGAPASAATSDEAELRRLTADYDRALARKDAREAAASRHADYAYTGPESVAAGSTEGDPAAWRLATDGGLSRDVAVRVVGPVAVVTGSFAADGGSASGRFASTWVRVGADWRLVAEHRSSDPATGRAGLAENRVRQESVRSDPVPADAAAVERLQQAQVQRQRGAATRVIGRLFRPYESTQLGYTFDQGEEAFLDFQFSTMFPLLHGGYPDAIRQAMTTDLLRRVDYAGPSVYFAGTVRAGQYLGTRPSSPVVGKRFNPLLAVRFWGRDAQGALESEDNFLEFAYGHESNGQVIASRARFDQQIGFYRNQDRAAPTPAGAGSGVDEESAFRSARDNISRGWDYIGVQWARDRDVDLAWAPQAKVALRARLNYFLPKGLLQGDAEEYNSWENDPQGKARDRVDGLFLRAALLAPPADLEQSVGWGPLRFERRYVLTWTTGYKEPLRFNTVKFEAGLNVYGLPLTVWYRYGYNSDLTDYYRRERSFGAMLSFWMF